VQIQGRDFSGFPGRDSDNLRALDYDGRVAWFKFRFELVFLHPFARLVALESNDCYVWLCVMNLAGAAISLFADFKGRRHDRDKFTTFLNTYLPTFAQAGFVLHDPTATGRNQPADSPAAQFYQFFRNGLAHDFCIQWGGLQHREEVGDVGHGYLFATAQGMPGEHGLGVFPREFVADFQAGCARFLADLERAAAGSALRLAFERTFQRVYLSKARPPLP
jgi:hypothetical protein